MNLTSKALKPSIYRSTPSFPLRCNPESESDNVARVQYRLYREEVKGCARFLRESFLWSFTRFVAASCTLYTFCKELNTTGQDSKATAVC